MTKKQGKDMGEKKFDTVQRKHICIKCTKNERKPRMEKELFGAIQATQG